MMLELQRPFLVVALAPHDDEWGHEPENLEVIGKLVGVPDLAVFGFQGLTTAGIGVDLDKAVTAGCFRWIGHLMLPLKTVCSEPAAGCTLQVTASRHSEGQVARTRFGWPCMKIIAGGRNRGVPKRGLHKMDRCPTIKSVRCVSVPQPVARYFLLDPSPLRRLADDPPDLRLVQVPALATAEHGGIVGSIASQDIKAFHTDEGINTVLVLLPLPNTVICPAWSRPWRSLHFNEQSSATRNPPAYRVSRIALFLGICSRAIMRRTSVSSRMRSARPSRSAGSRSGRATSKGR